MSFLVPKKPQILYAPMLSSFGGGSARGFNPGGVVLDAQGIADALVGGDTSVLTDDNMAIMTIDEAACETVFADDGAASEFLSFMLVQRYVANGNSFAGSGTSNTRQPLDYDPTLSPSLTVNRGFKADRQGNTAPDAAVYLFKNFHAQGSKFSYYHEGYNGWSQGNTPHFAGFSNVQFTSQFQNRAAIINWGSVNPLAYSQNNGAGTGLTNWQGYSHLPSTFPSDTSSYSQPQNKAFMFALNAPDPSSYQYFFVGVASDDGSTAGRTHKSHILPMYAAKNGFT